jgi:hypothetical protein
MNDLVSSDSLAQELGKGLTFLLATRGRLELDNEEWARMLELAMRTESPGRAILRRARCFRVWHTFEIHHVGLANTLHLPVDYDKAGGECVADPNRLGAMILEAWNKSLTIVCGFDEERFSVLFAGKDSSSAVFFEVPIIPFEPSEYDWDWNEDDGLDGYVKGTGVQRFSWQPHGSQFTVISRVPDNRLKLRIRRPQLLDRDSVLKQLKFDPSWVEIVK